MKNTFESRCGFCPRQYETDVKMPLYKYVNGEKPSGIIPLSSWGGLAVWLVQGQGDECIAAFNFGDGYDHAHRHVIYTSDSGREYIKKGNTRYYFDQIMRVC